MNSFLCILWVFAWQQPDGTLKRQLELAPGAYFPAGTNPNVELDVFTYFDSTASSWRLMIRHHVADAFFDDVFTWDSSVKAFCSGGDAPVEMLSIHAEKDCSWKVHFEQLQDKTVCLVMTDPDKKLVYYKGLRGN